MKLLGKNPKMICGFEERETGERAAAGAGGGTGTCGGRSGQRQGARGDGCPARRPSGSAAAAPLGLTAGPESQRSGGSGGLTILPRGPVPSNRHRPRCGSAGGSSLTFPAGGASARCPGPGGGGGGDDVGRGEGREEDWIRSGSRRRRKEKEEEPLEPEPPLPEPPLSTRGGSPSMPLSLSYCQYHRAAESMAQVQPNLLASSARPRCPLTGGFKREARPHWPASAFTPMPACSGESRSGIGGGGGAEKQEGGRRGDRRLG